jgi:hypothetical protein
MFERTQGRAAILLAAVACLGVCSAARAAEAVKLSGAISGKVTTGGGGLPQMGAVVALYGRNQRPFGRTLTDSRGEFRFYDLLPEFYTVRVTLAAFVPAIRKDILVQPGMRSLLAVNLSAMFSSIQVAYPVAENGSPMTDDWKWALRGGGATRPVLRMLDPAPKSVPGAIRPAVFSETRGILRVSGGDTPASTAVSESDLGAAFALATSVFGGSTLELSGNFALGAQSGIPSAVLRTGYRMNPNGDGPQFSLTVRQLYLAGRTGSSGSSDPTFPVLRTLSTSFDDRTTLAPGLTARYGFSTDSVSFLGRLTYVSPYAQLSYTVDPHTEVAFSYVSGNPRPELALPANPDSGLQRNLSALGVLPRVSLRDSRARIQRGEKYELSVSREMGSRKVQASAFRQSIRDAALTMVAPDGLFGGEDVLPDLFSGNSIFNAGRLRSAGYSAAITQSLGEHFAATLIVGSVGALKATRSEMTSNSPDELRAMVQAGRKRSATARIEATAPVSGTHFVASYQWTDQRWAMAGNTYSSQAIRPTPGLNVFLRQPIPGISSRPCRVEFTADLRNLLAQGYLPLLASTGQTVILVETPRSLRGGLNVIF